MDDIQFKHLVIEETKTLRFMTLLIYAKNPRTPIFNFTTIVSYFFRTQTLRTFHPDNAPQLSRIRNKYTRLLKHKKTQPLFSNKKNMQRVPPNFSNNKFLAILKLPKQFSRTFSKINFKNFKINIQFQGRNYQNLNVWQPKNKPPRNRPTPMDTMLPPSSREQITIMQ